MSNLKERMRTKFAIKKATAGKTSKEIKEAVEATTEEENVLHSLAQGANNFLIALTAGLFTARTLNQTRSTLKLRFNRRTNFRLYRRLRGCCSMFKQTHRNGSYNYRR